MRPELKPAIDALEEDLAALDRQAAELRNAINMLCARAGIAPRHAESSETSRGPVVTQVKPDTFYGKKMSTAVREFLDMRKRADMGPAKPRDIFDALTAGGFQYEAKDETTALISLRATLRKNSAVFHKLPNGQYGLKAWYPNAKTAKQEDDEQSPPVKRAAKKAAAPGSEAKGSKKGKTAARSSSPLVATFVQQVIKDGTEWTLDRLRAAAIAQPASGIDASVSKAAFHAALMGQKNRGLVVLVSKGTWRATNKTTSPAPTGEVVPIKGAA